MRLASWACGLVGVGGVLVGGVAAAQTQAPRDKVPPLQRLPDAPPYLGALSATAPLLPPPVSASATPASERPAADAWIALRADGKPAGVAVRLVGSERLLSAARIPAGARVRTATGQRLRRVRLDRETGLSLYEVLDPWPAAAGVTAASAYLETRVRPWTAARTFGRELLLGSERRAAASGGYSFDFAPAPGIEHLPNPEPAIGTPLVDAQGRLVALIGEVRPDPTQCGSALASAGGTASAVCVPPSTPLRLALPVPVLRRFLVQQEDNVQAPQAWLGMGVEPVTLPDLSVAVRVVHVAPGGAAATAKLQPDEQADRADIVTHCAGAQVSSAEQLAACVKRNEPGDSLKLKVYRGGKLRTVQVKLGTWDPEAWSRSQP